jgi:hypothetical protein
VVVVVRVVLQMIMLAHLLRAVQDCMDLEMVVKVEVQQVMMVEKFLEL